MTLQSLSQESGTSECVESENNSLLNVIRRDAIGICAQPAKVAKISLARKRHCPTMARLRKMECLIAF